MQTRVTTALGAVRGAEAPDASVASFRGIPFAAPPVGEARLAAPGPVAPWTGERDATRFGAPPPQAGGALLELLGTAARGEQSEDCLTLNVWTPGADAARRPVMVWIHGGAFISGASGVPVYDGSRLARRGDAVLVTFNYRVGALGWLHLDGREGLGGPVCTNLGLLDQIAALGWVRDHIADFGGDPGRVTLFGESAGAGSICALLAAPAARGLFHRAIVQSAAPDGFLTPDEARERSARLLERLGVAPGGLASASARAIVDAQQGCAAERAWKTGMFFTPVVDGNVLPVRPMQAVRDGTAAPVPLMIGTTRDELQLYKYGAPSPDLGHDAVVRAIGQDVPGDGPDGRPRAAEVLDAYRAARAARGESLEGIDLVYAFQTDLAMRGPAIRMAEHHARHRPDTFMYLFDWASPVQDGDLGACHALDLPFTFGTLDAPGIAALTGDGAVPRGIADSMADAWLAFARHGRPDTTALGAWPAYEPGRRSTMMIGVRSGPCAAPRDEERRILETIVAARTP